MDLTEALRTTGSVRAFTDEPVDDATLTTVLDNARFAPNGGNAQPWHVVVVKDPEVRRRLRDLYLPGWYGYLAMYAAGLRPWSPVNDPDAESRAVAGAEPAVDPQGFAENLDTAPVLLALFADLSALTAVDRDFDRYPFAGGGSIYPFAWSMLLAARNEGLGGVITTMCIRHENEVKTLLGASETQALAAVIALGHPVNQSRRLSRAPVESFATVDRVDGPAFG
jgi:nitroreductase